ncbi:cation diffusion facilitator family transporter [Listeria aquatica]|uniref:Cation transporter n=1 Tax=Listeria aquatica TaxID=1494960 RepID=A0A841ZTT9_9LIST|nr:cation diffusion facilitator family transporter [Listeria aquatica]MBC1522585.1 cation transporter [Listeria aquatica]
MGQHHSHDHHGHGHHHTHSANKKALFISFILIAGFMVAEVIGGILTNSLALLSDAGHMLSDAVALGLSLLAFKFGEKAASDSKTYGYRRFEILAAFFNGLTLIIISLFIFYEAYHRFFEPKQVIGSGMMTISVLGLLVNILVAYILAKGDTSGNLNMRSAFLHVLGDLLGSVGAIAAALLIIFFGWNIADPIASVLVSIFVLISGIRVFRESIQILMEGKPANVEIEGIRNYLLEQPEIESVHDLHVWSISSDFPSLTVHLQVAEDVDRDVLLERIRSKIENQFHVSHITIQMERSITHEHCN